MQYRARTYYDQQQHDRQSEKPDTVAYPFFAEVTKLPLPDRDAAVRHMCFADVPADNAGNGCPDYH
jgi:hypothetical protein